MKKSEKLTPRQVAEQMLEHIHDVDWGYVGCGMVQIFISPGQLIRWCEALDWPIPEGAEEAARAEGE
jgi:hypothetical protein